MIPALLLPLLVSCWCKLFSLYNTDTPPHSETRLPITSALSAYRACVCVRVVCSVLKPLAFLCLSPQTHLSFLSLHTFHTHTHTDTSTHTHTHTSSVSLSCFMLFPQLCSSLCFSQQRLTSFQLSLSLYFAHSFHFSFAFSTISLPGKVSLSSAFLSSSPFTVFIPFTLFFLSLSLL